MLRPGLAAVCQVALSLCLLIGILLLDDQRLGIGWLYWTGHGLIHALTLALLAGLLVGRLQNRSRTEIPRFVELAVLLLPVADLAILAVTRWSLVNVSGFQGYLMTVPMVWLAAQHRLRGAALGISITAASMAIGPFIVPGHELLPVLLRGAAVLFLASAVTIVVVSVTMRLDEHARRLESVTSALGVVSLVLDLEDGTVLESSGRLTGPARSQDVAALLSGPLFSENGRLPLPPERGPLARALGGRVLTGESVWVPLEGDRRAALSISSTRLDEQRMLLVVHDVTLSLGAVLQEEQFLANVSHELKTPLTSISGYIELIEDETSAAEGDPEMIRSHLRVVRRNVARLQQLILGLLETARTVSGDKVGSRSGAARVTLLDQLVRQQIEAIRPRAAARRLRWSLHGVDDALQLVNADPERLGQALDNILSNAVKYAHEGGLLTVDLGVEEGQARLIVTDEGIGIDQEDLEKLFTPYFRARTASRAGVAGYGLGLMITRRILRAHGGDMLITSQVGIGTRVEVTVPLART